MDRILSGLGKRTFLMHNVHEDHPQVFQVRWALSYLRGPLTRQQIKQLMDPVRPGPERSRPKLLEQRRAGPAVESSSLALSERPLLPPRCPSSSFRSAASSRRAVPCSTGRWSSDRGEVYFNDTKSGVSQHRGRRVPGRTSARCADGRLERGGARSS